MSVHIDTEYCKGCDLCVAVCPRRALRQGAERTAKAYLAPVHDSVLCVRCGTCAVTCPELAITVIQEG